MFVYCLSFGAVVAFANKIKIALQIFIVAATVTANKANFQVVGRVVKAMATAHKSTPAPRKTAANPKASSNGEGLAPNAITAQPKPSAYRHGRAAFAPKDAPPHRFPACLKILLVLPITPASRILSLDEPFVRRSVQPKQPALGSLPNKPFVCPLANKIEIAQAIEELIKEVYKTKSTVTAVNTSAIRGRFRSRKRHGAHPKDSKKAIVTIEGDPLPVYGAAE